MNNEIGSFHSQASESNSVSDVTIRNMSDNIETRHKVEADDHRGVDESKIHIGGLAIGPYRKREADRGTPTGDVNIHSIEIEKHYK